TAALAVLTALGGAATAQRIRKLGLFLAVGLVLVFPYADAARTTDGTGDKGGPVQALASADFDAFCQITNTVSYVQDLGATQGRQLLGAALFWVPRTLWAGKPQDTGIVLADFRTYKVTNLSAPLWAEFFINGQWLLLVAGMGALGFVLRRLDNHAVRRSQV